MVAKLILGCGYLGRRVADRWIEQGDAVYAVTRSVEHADGFRQEGLCPIVADVTQPSSLESLRELEEVTTVLIAIGYDRNSQCSIWQVYVDGVRAVVDRLPSTIERIIYISSTGVYGQSDGSWVDEDSSCKPTREGGKACLAAEQLLGNSRFADRVVILRLAGIYGPDRVPRREDLLQHYDALPQHGYVNLIHVADAVTTVLAAEQAVLPSRYVVADGQPTLRTEYYATLRQLMGLAEPDEANGAQHETDELIGGKNQAVEALFRQQSERRLGRGSKRIRSDRFRRELHVSLEYPNCAEGLRSILCEMPPSINATDGTHSTDGRMTNR